MFGRGPWKVFMLINLAPKPHRPAELRIHTNPMVVEALMNSQYSDCNDWTVIMTVGDFFTLEKAMEYHRYWTEKTRGLKNRINMGLKLFNHFKSSENLWACVIPFSRAELAHYKKIWADEHKNEETQNRKEAVKRFLEGDEEIQNVLYVVRLEDIVENKG